MDKQAEINQIIKNEALAGGVRMGIVIGFILGVVAAILGMEAWGSFG